MKLLVDSDFLFGLFVDIDVHHVKSVGFLKKSIKNKDILVVLNLVIQETATVLSKKRSQNEAVLFLRELQGLEMKIMVIGEEDESLAWEMFKKQTKKGTSFVDCANLAVAKKYKFDKILSFDNFYPKEIRLK